MRTGIAPAPDKGVRNLTARDPFTLFQNRLARLFEGLPPFLEESLPATTWMPVCDVYETDKELVIRAELPGINREQVFVGIENNTLTIHGERKFEETRRENYQRVESTYGEFMRAFTLPAFIDPNRIKAVFKDGLLTITLPKREEARPKQIEVKVE